MPTEAETQAVISQARRVALPSLIGMEIGDTIWESGWEPYPFLLDIERELVAAAMDQDKQDWFIVNTVNQCGKTSYVGVLFAFWYIGMFPDKQLIFISYSEGYSSETGRLVRDLFKAHGESMFGLTVDPNNDSQGDWSLTGHPAGGMLSVGIGGMITGRQGNCVVGETLIQTPEGAVPISEALRLHPDDLTVLSYDHASSEPQWKPVVARKSSSRSDIVEVQFESGAAIRCTSDHEIWIQGRGYVQAALLRPGDHARRLPDLRETTIEALEEGQDEDAPGLLSPGSTDGPRGTGLSSVRRTIRDDVGGLAQAGGATRREVGGPVLLSGVPLGGPRESASEIGDVPEVRAGKASEVQYLHELWGDRTGAAVQDPQRDSPLPAMRGEVPPHFIKEEILFEGVRRRGSLIVDDRVGKQQLQGSGGEALTERRPSPAGEGTRRERLHRLRGDGGAPRPSRRSQPAQQHRGEHGDALLVPPPATPPLISDAVRVVRRLRETQTVYDIQVADNVNFFADGILVHNCVLIDDILRTMEDAASAARKEAHWKEWQGTIWGRRQPGSVYVVMSTRLSEDDLSGRMLSQQAAGGGIPWKHLMYPGLCEPPDDYDGPIEGYRDRLGRAPGEPLHTRFSRPEDTIEHNWWTMARDQLGNPQLFDCMIQQNPTNSQSGMFPEDRWVKMLRADWPERFVSCRAWDIAETKGGGDFTVGALVSKAHDGRVFIDERFRDQIGPNEGIQRVKSTAEADGFHVPILIEEEKGGAAKKLVEFYRMHLPGYQVLGAPTDGTKEVRATTYSILQNGGKVILPADDEDAEWVEQWIRTHKGMMGDGRRPKHDDEIDAAAHAVRYLVVHDPAEYADASQITDERMWELQQMLEEMGL